ncbi:MAG TPA: NADP oxidoreductase [Microbacterium sp.]|nr:NADP oxidoreductase [Microbacterium sp.]
MTTIAVLGVGRVGSAVARTALRSGFDVNVAGSGAAEDITLLTEIVIPGAVPMTADDAVRDADIVILAVPLHKHQSIAPAPLAGKVVVDAMNWWSPVDGDSDKADDTTTSETVAEHFVDARLVKSLNHIGYHELEEDWAEPDTDERRALAVASDDEAAAELVSTMIDRFGFDPVYSGPLHTGRTFGPGTHIFNSILTKGELEAELTSHQYAL